MRAILMCLPLLLAACSPSPGPPSHRAADPADDNVIGAPLEQSLDKARSVEDLNSGNARAVSTRPIDERQLAPGRLPRYAFASANAARPRRAGWSAVISQVGMSARNGR